MRRLVTEKPFLLDCEDHDGNTPLSEAVREGHLEVARFLGPDLTANRSLEPTTKYARPVLVDENGAAIQPPRDAERKSGIKIKRPGLVPKCYCGRKAAKLCGRWVCSHLLSKFFPRPAVGRHRPFRPHLETQWNT